MKAAFGDMTDADAKAGNRAVVARLQERLEHADRDAERAARDLQAALKEKARREEDLAFEKMVQEIQAKAEAEWRLQEGIESKLETLRRNVERASDDAKRTALQTQVKDLETKRSASQTT